MAYIYKIINQINDKCYIGKTEFSIEKRFKEHCQEAFRERSEKRPLYAAIRKYGIENFKIYLIEETNSPEEREIYWIEFFQSFKWGYNATKGGDGRKYLDYDIIEATYKELQNEKAVSEKLNISKDSVRNVLHLRNIQIFTSEQVNQKQFGKIINQYDLNDNFIQSFPSAKKAAESLGKITGTSKGASSHITDVCKGKRKTAYGYKWKFGI